ncbi:MAG: phosphoribosylanthranilate isomerase [Armatimonadota bacterium]
MTPLLKICGLTRITDFRLAQKAGADFLGMIVEAPSPRSVSVEMAAKLAALAPQQAVAVVVSRDLPFLRRVIFNVKPRALQLHGPHAPQLVHQLASQCPIWVAVALPGAGQNNPAAEYAALKTIGEAAVAGAEMIVLDTAIKGQSGGTGEVSDWDAAARIVLQSPLPVLLAGGISPENAAEALAVVRPAGLDASSRLEINPGHKDPARVGALAQIVKG